VVVFGKWGNERDLGHASVDPLFSARSFTSLKQADHSSTQLPLDGRPE
jgi:hypothetical protein